MAIRALMLDFYGTLVREDDTLTRELCREICDRSPQNITPADVAYRWQQLLRQAYAACHGAQFLPLCDIQTALLEELCTCFESRAEVAEMMGRIRFAWEHPQPYAELRAFLTRLPLDVCVVANADIDVFEAACKHLQLKFPHVVLSETARCYKPDEGIFRAALTQMQLAPEEVLFVGDSLTYDMQPAIALGMRTVWINRNGRSRGDTKVDAALRDLLALKGIMK